MATVRKWEGRLIVTGDTTNIPPFHSHRMTLVVTPEEAITLARELRDAADPWSEQACIEWLRSKCARAVQWDGGEVSSMDIGVKVSTWSWRPDTRTELRQCVHEVATKRGIDCPLGDMCAICHPPAPPVPSDEELAKMGTEELIGWIKSNGYGAYYTNCNAFPWSATRNHPRASLESATLLGLAKIVAMQLREASA